MHESLGTIPARLSITKDINTEHIKNSNTKWNELLKRQSFEMLDFYCMNMTKNLSKFWTVYANLRIVSMENVKILTKQTLYSRN